MIGNFCGDKIGGQATKTRILYQEMQKKFGAVNQADVFEMNYIKLFMNIFDVMKRSKHVVIILASSGYFKILPVILFLNIFFHRKLYEVVIGGIRPQYVAEKKCRLRWEKKVTKIYAESQFMVKQYQKLGLKNAEYQPNFKRMEILPERELVQEFQKDDTLRLCTFSRVVKDKGIDTAVAIVEEFNRQQGSRKVKLDIFGPIEETYRAEFEDLLQKADYGSVRYCGKVECDEALGVLKKYDLLLFPTRHEGEGFPGTFLDAMAAGIPVLANKRESFLDVIKNGYNGYLIEEDNHNMESYLNCLKALLDDKDMLLEMKKHALGEAKKYLPECVLEPMWEEILENKNNLAVG